MMRHTLPAEPVILHVDMDAFFVSVEQLYDPALRGKPVIVGGNPNSRGVVAAASYEARRYGVHSAMPLRTATRLCPHAIFLPPRRERYEAASEKIRKIFEQFSPQVEMVSVDEAYLDLTGAGRLWGPPLRAAHRLHEEVARRACLPCSIGISRFRAVSKIASDQAKPNGILWIVPGAEKAFLAPLPVGRIPGVGKVTEESLRALGARRIGDLLRLPADLLQSKLGQHGLSLLDLAQGSQGAQDNAPASVEEPDEHAQDHARSISHEETFAEDVADPAALEAVLADLSQRVAARLRAHGLHARTLSLKLRYANFQTITRAKTLETSTQLDGTILDTARRLLHRHWDQRRKVRLLGVQAADLSRTAGQGNLWTAAGEEKWNRVLTAADRVRGRYGFSIVQLGAALAPEKSAAGEKRETERGKMR